MQRDAFPYHILVIRLWAEQTDPHWRITLETPAGQTRQGFTELRALLDEVEQKLTTLMLEHGPPEEDATHQLPHADGQ